MWLSERWILGLVRHHDDMHKEVRICKPTGLIANDSCEAAGKAVTKAYLVMTDPYTKAFNPNFKYCKPCPPTRTDTNIYSLQADSLDIVIVSPEDNANVGTSFTVTAQVAGPNPIVAVEFYIDGDWKNTKLNEPYTVIFSGVSPGNHEITVKAFDDSGDSVEKSIDVDVSGGLPLINSPPVH